MDFAQVLQKLMDERGLSNYQLAKDLDVHPTTITNWLEGKTPRKKTQLQLADYFRVSVPFLMGEEQKPPTLTKKDEQSVSEDYIKAAFWGGDKDLSKEDLDEMWNDVRKFADFVKAEKKKKKGL